MTHETLRHIVMTTENQSSDKIIKCWDIQTFHRAGISNISAIATQGSLSSELKSQIMSDWHCQKIFRVVFSSSVLPSAPLCSTRHVTPCPQCHQPVSLGGDTGGQSGPRCQAGAGHTVCEGGWQTRAVLLEMAENVLYKFKILQCDTTSNARILLFMFSYSKDQFLTWPNMENFFLSILFPMEFIMGQQPPAQPAHLIRLLWLAWASNLPNGLLLIIAECLLSALFVLWAPMTEPRQLDKQAGLVIFHTPLLSDN